MAAAAQSRSCGNQKNFTEDRRNVRSGKANTAAVQAHTREDCLKDDGKTCRGWGERVMIPYNFSYFEEKRGTYLSAFPLFLVTAWP
jgi:hypothetical protein